MMVEVKLRLATLNASITPPSHAIHPDAFVEFAYLQLRKALELVALASLVSNRDAYSAAYNSFEKARDARLIFRELERVNPHFYPKPVVEIANPQPGVGWHLDPYKGPFLTESKFVKLYARCGSILHTQNPHKAKPNISALHTDLSMYRDQITALLNVHIVQLANDGHRYLVHMQEQDGDVHHYVLAPRNA